MKSFFKIMLLLILPALSFGQQDPFFHFPDKNDFDSLKNIFQTINNDTERMAAYRIFGFYFAESKRDSSYYFLDKQLTLARKFGLKLWEADALDNSAYSLWRLGNFPKALQRLLQGIKIAEDPASEKSTWGLMKFTANKNPRTARLFILAQLHFDLAQLYGKAGYTEKQLTELLKGEKTALQNDDKSALSQIYEGLGSYYLSHRGVDSALTYLQQSVAYSEQSGFKLMEGDCLNYIGNAYAIKRDYTSAKINYLKSIRVNKEQNSEAGLTHNYISLAELFIKQNNKDSSLYYAKEAEAKTAITMDLSDAANAYAVLSAVFKMRNNIDSAYKYQSMSLNAKDNLNNAEKVKQFENIGFTEELRVQQLEEEKIAVQNKIKIYAMLAGLAIVLLVALLLYYNNLQKQKANKVLETTLSNLKSTQSQLIQSEKMASLGELTAGIAHEIQNPLNFVNNFSDVNTELIDEAGEEINKGNIDEVKNILNDIKENEQKINHHGKRAGDIVKGMLQHSRSSTGVKEPTDINALADEYLRLSYHGLRAKDKDFNATMKTDFDESIGKINIIPQDIGRVLLNLYNNAFYACTELSRSTVNQQKGQNLISYEPVVSVTTKKSENHVIIIVSDNGNGIPQKIVDKIFQPFFTTRPTGQGTGLGLSLSYDIVKAHGGEIKVKTKEGEGSEFIIQLPIN